jgi:hypothetical protein
VVDKDWNARYKRDDALKGANQRNNWHNIEQHLLLLIAQMFDYAYSKKKQVRTLCSHHVLNHASINVRQSKAQCNIVYNTPHADRRGIIRDDDIAEYVQFLRGYEIVPVVEK